MNNKLDNARFEEKKARGKYMSQFNYLSRRWGQDNRNFMSQFNILLQHEIVDVWETGRARVLAKIDFLAKKWHSVPNEVQHEIDDVAISDQKLEEQFGPIEEEDALIFGGAEDIFDDNEKEVLKTDPNFRIYPRLDKEDINVSIQTMFVKTRWDMMAREQRDGEKWSEEWQWEQTRQKTVYDEENSTLFFDKRRHTDLKTVRRLDPPEPCPQVINGHPVEVVLANINTGIQNIFQDYSEKNCDKNGFVREKNLTE